MLGTQDLWLFISSGISLNFVPGQGFIFIVSYIASKGFQGASVATLGVSAGTLGHIIPAAFRHFSTRCRF